MSQLSLTCLDQIILSHGSHEIEEARPLNPEVTPPQLCAMEAAAWLAGEDHTDRPTCVCEMIGVVVRTLNDRIEDDILRTTLLKPLIPRLVGTDASKATQIARIEFLVKYIVTVDIPRWVACVGEPYATHAQQLTIHYPDAEKWTYPDNTISEYDSITWFNYMDLVNRLQRLMSGPVLTNRLVSALFLSEWAERFSRYPQRPYAQTECYKGLAEAISCMVDIHE